MSTTHSRPVRVTQLVFGLLFLGAVGVWILGEADAIQPEDAAVAGPLVLIAAGVVGLVASLANGRRRQAAEASAYAQAQAAYLDYQARYELGDSAAPAANESTDGLDQIDTTDQTKEIR